MRIIRQFSAVQRSSAASVTLPITVVIPTFNRRALIMDAIRSVHDQSYKPLELIIVDDGSTDDTTKVLRAAGLLVLQQDRGGISAARNRGILAATQPWIAFLDDDDIWYPSKLERQWGAAQACSQAGFIFSDMTFFDALGTRAESLFATRPDYRELERETPAPHVACFHRQTLIPMLCGFADNFMMPSTLLIRRDVLLAAGMFDVHLPGLEGRELLMRLLRLTDAAAVDEPLVQYRLHDAQAIRDVGRTLQSFAAIVDAVCDHPNRYPDEIVQHLRTERAKRHYLVGRYFVSARHFPDAAVSLRRSLRFAYSRNALLWYWFAATLASRPGVIAFALLRSLKRRLSR